MKVKAILSINDLVIVAASFLLSSLWVEPTWKLSWVALGLFVIVKGSFLAYFGLYRAILRFAGLLLAASIIKALAISTLILLAVTRLQSLGDVPLVFFVLDFFITTFLVGMSRFLPRYWWESRIHKGRKRVLIYGAGVLGEEVARKLLKNNREYHLLGFIDDKPSMQGHRIHNCAVLGPIDDLRAMLTEHKIDELILAIPEIRGEQVRQITRECNQMKVCCRIVPAFVDVFKKEINIKDVDIADLLKREPRDLDKGLIERFLKGKVILITGAAGSIGSELVRQCLKFHPKKLLMLDKSEHGLFELEEEFSSTHSLSDSLPKNALEFILMDLSEKDDISSLIEQEQPDVIFHAAAYKHVPILESNPFAAVRNNIQGTLNLAKSAHRHKVDKFVLISTDKAVRPTSIMGATKRACELFIQNLSLRSKTEFVSVRFGNVLGSSGSVIPKFIRQINKGGPVTVTHPHVTRYFMLTQEAVLLVMQAASLGNGGEIFILNMGEAVRIADMAEDLIYLSGKRPHKDVEIVYTGLRPGEKLYEELLIDEMEKKTQYENITIGKTSVLDWDQLNENLDQLISYACNRDLNSVVSMMRMIIPEFKYGKLGQAAVNTPNLIPFPRYS